MEGRQSYYWVEENNEFIRVGGPYALLKYETLNLNK